MKMNKTLRDWKKHTAIQKRCIIFYFYEKKAHFGLRYFLRENLSGRLHFMIEFVHYPKKPIITVKKDILSKRGKKRKKEGKAFCSNFDTAYILSELNFYKKNTNFGCVIQLSSNFCIYILAL